MKKVRKIDWTFHTSTQEGSGTDSKVTIKIFRDNEQLAFMNQEPGETARLDRGENGTYYWIFKNPSGLGTAVSGKPVPYTEEFPDGLNGHLKVQFEIWGDDAWRIGNIESKVYSGEMEFVPGTIDDWNWEETPDSFSFNGEDVMSSNNEEGIRKLTLHY